MEEHKVRYKIIASANTAAETQSGQQANICVWFRPGLLVLGLVQLSQKVSNVKVSRYIQNKTLFLFGLAVDQAIE